jgi:hypothetical protein
LDLSSSSSPNNELAVEELVPAVDVLFQVMVGVGLAVVCTVGEGGAETELRRALVENSGCFELMVGLWFTEQPAALYRKATVRLGRRVIVVVQAKGGWSDGHGWPSKDSVTNADGKVAGVVAVGERRSWDEERCRLACSSAVRVERLIGLRHSPG